MSINIIDVMPVFWCLYGIAGLLGFQFIHDKYKDHWWTLDYIRCRGVSWLILGIPWLAVAIIRRYTGMSYWVAIGLLVVVSVPSLVYGAVKDKKFKALLENDE